MTDKADNRSFLCLFMRHGLVIKTALSSTTVPENKEKRFNYNKYEALNDNRALSEIDM